MHSLIASASLIAVDIDDTLYLEREYQFSGFRALDAWASETLRLPDFSSRARQLFDSGTRGRIFDEVLVQCGIEPTRDRIMEMVKRFRDHVPAIRLQPDALAFLEALHGTKPLAVISDGYLVTQANKVRALGLKRFMDPIILTGEWGPDYWKPHPRAFETLESTFGLPGRACLYIGDNPSKDFSGCRPRGWSTVRICRDKGEHRNAPSRKGEVDLQVRTLAELISS